MNATKFRNLEAAAATNESIDFSFGENWQKYAQAVDEATIQEAQADFCRFSQRGTLEGCSFLDIGCGSGLNSLIANRLGANRVLSVDIDPNSIAAATYLRSLYDADSETWKIRRESILDDEFTHRVGKFSYVLSWGVLHHTGDLWTALDHAADCVEPHGKLHIALYNWTKHSAMWLRIKRGYNRCPGLLKPAVRLGFTAAFMLRNLLLLRSPWSIFKQPSRGMDYWRDLEDWLGGLPYEYCKPDQVVARLAYRGFVLRALTTNWSHGCNEFLFEYYPELATRNAP